MVATDTIVGIVGAVVLVGVMAGVFVYEYNNQPVEGGGTGTGSVDFQETYPALAASEDLDGDGVPNSEDDDLDGDGTPNQNDTDVAYREDVSGVSLGQHVPTVAPADDATVAVFAVTGVVSLDVQGTYSSTAPTTDISVELLDEDGNPISTGSGAGGSVSLQAEGLAPGNYTIVLSHQAASDGADFSEFYWIANYPAPAGDEAEE